ncbi:hypothetical protein CTAYLR_000450 [Chrysophaeum taylorii]|uniref:Enoyl reductase (ER) domain-containing protein n=1 Tax=Chrysophaeum taylorii TaxID=2483200 RepID=A0AAD7UIC9_9STRA|nr:hypothetical protein CTAYLR_000450 [Chrysophaeum taylorii]
MTRMRAAVVSAWSPLHVNDAEIPAINEDEVLIAVCTSSVGAVDRELCAGASSASLPIVPGMDVAGVVAGVGSRVTRFRVGDEVWCVAGDLRHRTMGAWSEFVSAAECRVGFRPTNLTFDEAGALPLVGLTALQAVRRGMLMPGNVALVLGGSGGVGVCAVQIARAFGASKVYATCSSKNIDLLRSLGAVPINYQTHDCWDDLDLDLDFVLDTVGEPGTLDKASKCLRPDGHFVSIVTSSDLGDDHRPPFNTHFICATCDDSNDLDELKALCEANELSVPIQAIFDLDDLPKALTLSPPLPR